MAPEGRSGTGEHRDDAGTAAAAATGATAPGETGDGARPASGRAGGRRRGGRGRGGQGAGAEGAAAGPERADDGGEADPSGAPAGDEQGPRQAGRPPRARAADDDRNPELPDRHIEGRPKSVEAAERALVPRKPRIGDTMPAPPPRPPVPAEPVGREEGEESPTKRRRRGGRGRGGAKREGGDARTEARAEGRAEGRQGQAAGQGQGGRGRSAPARPVEQVLYDDDPVELDERALRKRRGKERKGRPVGRYVMCVHVAPKATQIAVLEGRSLVEHYVSRPADDVAEIHGNIYLGKVQNVLPGMEAAFVDIGTPKNAVLYRGDVQYEKEDLEGPAQGPGGRPRIEQVLKARQTILCQVTKNPIAHKGARLTQEVSLPGRFVVLIPNSTTYGISKRLPDNERRRLRHILDQVKPPQHGVIVRTAAEGVTEEEIERDVRRLLDQWAAIEALAKRSTSPALLYREPDLALRVIREEFNDEYRSIIIDDRALFEEVRSYVASISPALADRVEYFDPSTEPLPLFERHHVHEQRLRALDRKVWLPSGGSLIIEHTEALTVIDVNTGKNVGTSSLEETVFRNNLEAAVEIARQLRLRDIGGIIVIDFVDMEIRENRDEVIRAFREALGRDKTRTQVFEISELGLVEMTRKRIGEGLIESVSCRCPNCEGRGLVLDDDLVGEDA
jgi:ribonuclease E